MLDNEQRIRLRATELRRDFETACGKSDGPLDLYALAVWLGLAISLRAPFDLGEGVYGYLEPEDNVINLASGLPDVIARFTLAHEIGHALLHRSWQLSGDSELAHLCPESAIDEAPTILEQDVLLEGENYNPHNRMERAANLFAAELLMPGEAVRAACSSGYTLTQLAEWFGVSMTALLNQMITALFSPLPAPEHSAYLSTYDTDQQRAIAAPSPALIVAGPGSGKTSTLIGRIIYLLEQQRVPPSRILALTFSNKAALEMRERLERALPTLAAQLTVSTFHSFCADVLRRYGHHSGLKADFALLEDADAYVLLESNLARLPLQHFELPSYPTFYFPDLLRAISRAKDELVTPQGYRELAEQMVVNVAEAPEKQESGEAEHADARDTSGTQLVQAEKAVEIAGVYAVYQQALEERGALDFGDLIMQVVQLLRQYPQVREELQTRYTHLVVDEFQDINRASGELIRELAGAAQRLWVVGDADQSIYKFRGASPANIAKFTRDYPGAQVLQLGTNYRSLPGIVAFSQALALSVLHSPVSTPLARSEDLPPVRAARTSLAGKPITIAVADDEQAEAAGIAKHIRERLTTGYTLRQQVVLCRTRSQASRLARLLETEAIPVELVSGGSSFESPAVKDLLALLALSGGDLRGLVRLAQPSPESVVTGYLLPSLDLQVVLEALRNKKDEFPSPALLAELALSLSPPGRTALTALSQTLTRLGSHTRLWEFFIRAVLEETDLLDLQQKELSVHHRTLDAVRHLLVLARRFELRPPLLLAGDRQGKPANVHQFLTYIRLLIRLKAGGRPATEGGQDGMEAVRVLTVHASKGLEFPIVYIPNLAAGRFPPRPQGDPVPVVPGLGDAPANPAQQKIQRDLEEGCLFYVALTRAQDEVVLSRAERYGKLQYKPSLLLEQALAASPALFQQMRWSADRAVPSHDSPGEDLVPEASASASPISPPSPASPLRVGDLERYLVCPRQYFYSNVYGLPGGDSVYQRYQRYLSKQLRLLKEQAASGRIPTWKAVSEAYHVSWEELELGGYAYEGIYREQGLAVLLATWQSLTGKKQTTMPGSRVIKLGNIPIQVDIDQIEIHEGKPHLLHHRTSARKKRENDATLQRLLIYKLAYQQEQPASDPTIQVRYLATNEVQDISLSKRKEKNLTGQLLEAAQGLARQDFAPKPDPNTCKICPYVLICPANED